MIKMEYESLIFQTKTMQRETNLNFKTDNQRIYYEKIVKRIQIIEEQCKINHLDGLDKD